MSHIVTIQTQVRDPAAIRLACARLELPEPVHGTVRLFQDEATGWQVRLPEWRYPGRLRDRHRQPAVRQLRRPLGGSPTVGGVPPAIRRREDPAGKSPARAHSPRASAARWLDPPHCPTGSRLTHAHDRTNCSSRWFHATGDPRVPGLELPRGGCVPPLRPRPDHDRSTDRRVPRRAGREPVRHGTPCCLTDRTHHSTPIADTAPLTRAARVGCFRFRSLHASLPGRPTGRAC